VGVRVGVRVAERVAVTASGAAIETGALLNNNQPNKTPASPMQVMKIIDRFIFMQASDHEQIIFKS